MLSKELADKLTEMACKQLLVSTDFKRPRLERINVYEQAYLSKTQARTRSMFNLPNLVFSGMVDALKSDFDEKISLKFKPTKPSDYNGIKKLNEAWKVDVHSLRPTGRWNLKLRVDKSQAIFWGRSVEKTYAETDPKYHSIFQVVDMKSFHFEPKGGPILENHLFLGEEDIFKTMESLEQGAEEGLYSAEQIKLIKERRAPTDNKDDAMAAYQSKMAKFSAMNMDADANNYVGQDLLNCCEWGLTYKGERYYLLFDAFTRTWIRAEKWKDVFESGLWHWTSWATHEDLQLFLSKSYADDLYPVGEAVKNLLDQELTNRQKRNLGAKAYDKRFFPDVAKLDAAQYRPDALVPVTVPEGKTIKDGVFLFETPELQGTINLINWVEQDLGKHAGITELNGQALQKGAKANVQYSLLQQAQKRIGYQSSAYQECYQEIGLRYAWGLVEHMNEERFIQMVGAEGAGWNTLTRAEVRALMPFDVIVESQTEEDKLNVIGKQQKKEALGEVMGSEVLMGEVNPKVVLDIILRDVGGFSEEVIARFLDKQNFGQKDILSEADKAIEMLRKGKMPDIYFDATTGFLSRIHRWERAHQNLLKKDVTILFQQYIDTMMPIVQENMAYQAVKQNMQNGQVPGQQPGQPPQPGGAPQPGGQPGTAPVPVQQQEPSPAMVGA